MDFMLGTLSQRLKSSRVSYLALNSTVLSGKGLKFQQIRSEKTMLSRSDWLKYETLTNNTKLCKDRVYN